MWVGIVGSRSVGECRCEAQEKHWPPTADEKAHQEECLKVTSWLLMLKVVTRLLKSDPELAIVSGGARGADTLAIDAGRLLGLPDRRLKVFPVQDGAGSFSERAKARNTQIVERSDMLIAVFGPGRRSPGTSDTVTKALKKGIPVHTWHEGSWSTS